MNLEGMKRMKKQPFAEELFLNAGKSKEILNVKKLE
jgi:hypothetical protein